MVALVTIVQLVPGSLPTEPETCIEDRILMWTEPMNTFFAQNVAFKNAFLIFASGIEDFMMLALLVWYILRGSSYRLPLTLGLFYGLRALFGVSLSL